MSKTTAAITPLLGLLALAACDSAGSDGEPGADNACLPDPDIAIECTDEGDCPAYDCRCADGTTGLTFGPCVDGTCTASTGYECERDCANRGGVDHASTLPNPTVVGSQACTDWCARLVAESARLGCGGIERCPLYSDCDIGEGECSATARERLACMAETAVFTCDADGVLQVDADCRPSASCDDDPCLR